MSWTFTDAKNRLSEVARLCEKEGEQVIVRSRGEDLFVMTRSERDGLREKKKNFIQHLLSAPKCDELEPLMMTERGGHRDVDLS